MTGMISRRRVGQVRAKRARRGNTRAEAAIRTLKALAGIVVVLAACGGGRTQAVATPPRPADTAGAEPAAPAPMIAEPAVNPSVAPAGLIATVTIDQPDVVLAGIGAYLVASGKPGAPAELARFGDFTGLAADRPMLLLVVSAAHGPAPLIAGTVGDEEDARLFAKSVGMEIDVRDGIVVVGPRGVFEIAAAYARWRLDQPGSSGLRFEVSAEFLNESISRGLAAIPNSPLGSSFDSLASVTGELAVGPTEATLTFVLGARAGTVMDAVTTSLVPSQFALAGAVSTPGAPMYMVGTMDFTPVMALLRGWLGGAMDAWTAVLAVSDGDFAFRSEHGAGALSMIGMYGLRDAAAAGAALDTAIGRLATPVEVNHMAVSGRPRVKKVAGRWVHEVTTTMTADATEKERAAILRLWGADSVRALMGVYGSEVLTTQGPEAEKAIAALAGKKRRGVPVTAPALAAAVAEATRAGDSVLLVMDLAHFFAQAIATVKGGAPSVVVGSAQPMRIGMGLASGAMRVRIVVPAAQIAAIKAMMP